MRTITLADPALTSGPAAWMSARGELRARAEELREREAGLSADGGEEPAQNVSTPVGRRSYLDRERAERSRLAAGADRREQAEVDAEAEAAEPEREVAGPVSRLSYLDRERAERSQRAAEAEQAEVAEPEPEPEAAMPVSRGSYLDRERAERNRRAAEAKQPEVAEAERNRRAAEAKQPEAAEPGAAEPEPEAAEPESEAAEPEPEVANQPEQAEPEPEAAEPEPEVANQPEQAEPESEAAKPERVPGGGRGSEAVEADQPEPRQVEQRPQLRKERALDPDWIGARPMFRDEAPTRPMPRIEFEPSEGVAPTPSAARKPPRVAPMQSVVLNSQPDPDPPTLGEPEELDVPEFLAPDFGASSPPPEPPQPAPDPPTLINRDDLVVPDFMVPGFAEPAPEPPLRTVLSTVLGPELWQRCYAEWEPTHCAALARVARSVDGLAPSAGAAVRASAGVGMRWLGVVRERALLADLVAGAISHPTGATDANRARTVRLYGAAICTALNIPLRRCACHRDLERDVSGELIRLGLEELAGEVP